YWRLLRNAGHLVGGNSNVKLYRTTLGGLVEEDGRFYELSPIASAEAWDELICDVDLRSRVAAAVKKNTVARLDPTAILAPIGSQEVWAAGVTYFRSRKARMEESKMPEAAIFTTGSTPRSGRSSFSKPQDGAWSVREVQCESGPMRSGLCRNQNSL